MCGHQTACIQMRQSAVKPWLGTAGIPHTTIWVASWGWLPPPRQPAASGRWSIPTGSVVPPGVPPQFQTGSTSAHNPSHVISDPPVPPITPESQNRRRPAESDVVHCCVDATPPEIPQHTVAGSYKNCAGKSSTTYKTLTPSQHPG